MNAVLAASRTIGIGSSIRMIYTTTTKLGKHKVAPTLRYYHDPHFAFYP